MFLGQIANLDIDSVTDTLILALGKICSLKTYMS